MFSVFVWQQGYTSNYHENAASDQHNLSTFGMTESLGGSTYLVLLQLTLCDMAFGGGLRSASTLLISMKMLLLINKISNMHGLCKNKTHKYSKTGTKWNNTGRYGDGDSPVHHNCKHTTHDTVLYHMCVKSVFSNQLLNRRGDLQQQPLTQWWLSLMGCLTGMSLLSLWTLCVSVLF